MSVERSWEFFISILGMRFECTFSYLAQNIELENILSSHLHAIVCFVD